ncbi:MAG: NAD(+)/NADH kinase [Acidobacteria bacterium]|nr:NAD(+)/NADH kinase [Acidobacteriota bacterium]MBI3423934.1 NAD(+)/NADH kinase [Acidobacteriota bacterium]
MEINSCVVAIKQTALAQGGRAAQFAQSGDATAKRLLKADATHQRTVETVRKSLQKHGISALETPFKKPTAQLKRHLAQADLVITIGGDGTALGASHFVTGGALLGVNSAPGDSVGHFCSVHGDNFNRQFEALLKGQWLPTELTRLAVALDDKPLPELALNDILIAHDCPAATTRYLIKLGEREEEQRSSGIWISTAAGSTAGIHSAGGRKMSLRSHRLQYLVRELYREIHGGHQYEYELERGLIDPGESLTVASKMPEGWLYIDGARTAYRFPFGTRATLRAADARLRLFL